MRLTGWKPYELASFWLPVPMPTFARKFWNESVVPTRYPYVFFAPGSEPLAAIGAGFAGAIFGAIFAGRDALRFVMAS